MRKIILSVVSSAALLSVNAQYITQQSVAFDKNTKVVSYYEDQENTESLVTKYEDNYLNSYFYDSNGNKVLESYYNVLGRYYYKTVCQYDERNLLVEEIISEDGLKYKYEYNDDATLRTKTKIKVSTDAVSEVVSYEYENGILTAEIVTNSSGKETGRYRYSYEGSRLSMREFIIGMTTGSDPKEKISRRAEYIYDASGNLVDMIEYTLSTTTSSLGTIRSAKRNQYAYDSSNRKIQDIYMEASATSGVLGEWSNIDKRVYSYSGAGAIVTKSEYYRWDNENEVFVQIDYSDYLLGEYNKNKVPRNFAVSSALDLTSVTLTFDAPVDNEGIVGYSVIIDDQYDTTVYESSPIVVPNQKRGLHTYRVMAIYGEMPGNVTDKVPFDLDIDLPMPSNGRMLTQEYTTRWNVTFGFDAPEADDNFTLTGYRYEVVGGNGGAKGDIDDPTALKGAFAMYRNTADNEQNLVTVKLYAKYEEGESDAHEFQIDLRDTENQVVAHWLNTFAEHKDANGSHSGKTHYYYTSSSVMNTEALSATVEYDAQSLPQYRTIDGKTDKWNSEANMWEKYMLVEEEKIGTSSDYTMCYTTKMYDAEKGDYIAVSVVKNHFYFDMETWETPNDWTRHYDIVDGQEVYKQYVAHIEDDDLITDIEYLNDESTITGKVERRYDAQGVLLSTTRYNYTGGNYEIENVVENVYDTETKLIVSETKYRYNAGNKELAEKTEYTASKDYHYINTPFGLVYNAGVLSWSAPSIKSVTPTGYRVYADNIQCAYTEETSVALTDLPSGKYRFTVMCDFNGSESSLSSHLDAQHVNLANFKPVTVDPAPYDAALENSVSDLTKVTLTMPAKVADIDENVVATLNSRFAFIGEAHASLSDDAMSVIFTLPTDLVNGIYYLTIPQGLIVSEDGTYNCDLDYMFMLQLPLTYDLPTPTVDPNEGRCAELNIINLKFDREVFVVDSNIGVAGLAYVEDSSTGRTDATVTIEGFDYTCWSVTLSQAINSNGNYTLVVPAGLFGDANAYGYIENDAFTTGSVNPEYRFEYTIDDTSVDAIATDNNVKVEGNNIFLPAGAKVYNTSGMEVSPFGLPAGVYIVALDKAAVKVIIK